jgi:hypothetical protein
MSYIFDCFTCKTGDENKKQGFMGLHTQRSSLATNRLFNDQYQASEFLDGSLDKNQCKHVNYYDVDMNTISSSHIKKLLERLTKKTQLRQITGQKFSALAANNKTRSCKLCERTVYMDNKRFQSIYAHFERDDMHSNPLYAMDVSRRCPHCYKGELPFTPPQGRQLAKINDDISALRTDINNAKVVILEKMRKQNKVSLKSCVGMVMHESCEPDEDGDY